MIADDVRAAVLTLLVDAVPGAVVDDLAGEADLRDELDMDSLDVLTFAAAVSRRFAITVPEADYPRLLTLDGCVAYVTEARSRS